MLMKTTIGLLAILAAAFAQTPPAAAPAGKAAAPAAVHHKTPMVNPALYKHQAPATFKVKFTTTKGAFVVEVHRDWAPNGADRFYNLARGGFFDGGPFYRVKSGFMAQFGFSPSPTVNKAWTNATIKDDKVTQSNKRGYLTFAATGAPNSRSTHLFINYADNKFLDAQGFAPFGQVVEGMDVVEKLDPEYGDGDQDKIGAGGAAFVKKAYPRMDLILTAELAP
jgi:peptidyl-prolyl cis-trans isomerase A (cyclophilin A)